MSDFANRLLMLRKAKSLSQEELANMIGTSQRQVSKYETGKNEPTASVLDALADSLNTTTDYLLGRTNIVERPTRGMGDLADSESEVIRMLRGQDADTRERIINAIKALIPEAS